MDCALWPSNRVACPPSLPQSPELWRSAKGKCGEGRAGGPSSCGDSQERENLGRSEAVGLLPTVGLPGSHVLTQEPQVPPNDLHVRLTIALGKAGMGVY